MTYKPSEHISEMLADGDIPPMPDNIAEAYDKVMNHVIAELGESPEAWRGAHVIIESVIRPPIAVSLRRKLAGNEDEDASDKIISLILAICLGLIGSPWWSLGNEGQS